MASSSLVVDLRERRWQLSAAGAAIVVVASIGLIWWRARSSPPAKALLAIPARVTGPVPAEATAASTGASSGSGSARWDVVRTGAAESTTRVDVRGEPATLVRCPNGTRAVLWTAGADRLTLSVRSTTELVDDDELVDLAGQVRRAG